jgi:hypothetical protein
MPEPEPEARCDCDGNGWVSCPDCWGAGWGVVCCDDLCRGVGYCIHGDNGEAACPYCHGSGEVRCSCYDESTE